MLAHQEKAQICGYKLPQYFWFVISGALCDVIQACLDYLISLVYVFEWEKVTVCWTLSYCLSIFVRHTSHRFIVFGEYEGTYWSSLMRTYLAYSSSIVISIVTNHLLVNMVQLSHKEAWIATMLWTGLFNYFVLKASWKAGGDKTSSASSTSNTSDKLNV
jgi:putative flippase GtrA